MRVLVTVMVLTLTACATAPETAPPPEPDDALRSLAMSVDLSEYWPCGIGFAASDPEQQVAVAIYTTEYPPGPVPTALPDPGWDATIRVGTDLMANHCDDVVEEGEPVAETLAQWPISASSFTFDAPPEWPEVGCPATVTATLTDVVASTPSGPLELGDLTITNTGFGCFAG